MARTRGAQTGRGRGRTGASSSQQPEEENVQQPEEEIVQQRDTRLHPLLTQQHEHRLQSLMDGVSVPPLLIRHGFRKVRWYERYEPYVRAAGFLGIHQIGSIKWDDALIRAFVERWRPETHTFHLPVGEMTITLEDVSVLLGLPIHGAPVCGVTDMNWNQIVQDNLGVFPEGKAMANRSAVSNSWLRQTFDRLEYNASQGEIEQGARAYLLSVLGTVLFVDLTGDSTPAMYLPFLSNFNETRSYAWGAAVLARLYRQLCHGSGKGSKQMGGCTLLLQLWIWERFPCFRPKCLNRTVLERLTPETMPPRGFYWSGHHDWVENKRSLDQYRMLIDQLQDGDVEWMPYSPEIMNGLPPASRLHEEYWLSAAALMDFAIVETYHPDRTMRQFGKFQTVPPPARSTQRDLHAVDRVNRGKTDWRAFHRVYFDEWSLHRDATIIRENRPYDPNGLELYMQWYNSATIPTFQGAGGLCTDGGPARDRLLRPEINMKQLVKKLITFAKKAVRKMRGKGDKKFAKDAFEMCREVVGTVDDVRAFDREIEQYGEEDEGEEVGEEEEAETDEEEERDEEEGDAADVDWDEIAEEGGEAEEEIVEEAEEAEEEAVEDEDDAAFWNTTISQARSQLTQQPGPSRPKRPRRTGANYK